MPDAVGEIGLQLVELPAGAVERGRPERPSVPCLDQACVQLDASTAAGRDNGQERVSVQLPTDFRDGPGRGSILLHGAWREDLNRLALREVAVHGGEETIDDIAGVGAELVLEGEEGHQSISRGGGVGRAHHATLPAAMTRHSAAAAVSARARRL